MSPLRIIENFTYWTGFSLTGLSFLYVFLPLLLAGYYLLPQKWRTAFLLVASAGYYLLVGSGAASLGGIAASVLLDALAARWLTRLDSATPLRRAILWASVGKNIAFFVVAGLVSRQQDTPFLLGTMVCVLSGISAVVEVYRREEAEPLNLSEFVLYLGFFPRLHTGPFYTYSHFTAQLRAPKINRNNLLTAFGLYLGGAFKALVLGGGLNQVYIQLRGFTPADATVFSSWITLLCFAMTLYFFMAGFAEMAQGVGLLLGLSLPRDFYYPYQSRNVTDFSQRFHATLGQILRRCLFPPSDKPVPPLGNIGFALLWGALLGLGFGFRVNNLIWGLYLAVFLLLENYVYPKLLAAIPVFPGRVYALIVVMLGFTLLAGGTLSESWAHFCGLFGFVGGGALYNDKILYLLDSNWLLLSTGVLLCSSLADVTGRWLGRVLPRTSRTAYMLLCGAVLVLYTALAF